MGLVPFQKSRERGGLSTVSGFSKKAACANHTMMVSGADTESASTLIVPFQPPEP